jgi:hypothetical protein
MFGFVQSQGSQLLMFWPKTRSNELISPNISEHVRTLFVLFACPTTEQVLPLSIRQGELFVGPPGVVGRRKILGRAADLSEGEPPQIFWNFFWIFLVPRVAVSGSRWARALGSQNQRRGDPAAYRVKVMGGERLASACVGSGRAYLAVHANSMGDLLCAEQTPFKEDRAAMDDWSRQTGSDEATATQEPNCRGILRIAVDVAQPRYTVIPRSFGFPPL